MQHHQEIKGLRFEILIPVSYIDLRDNASKSVDYSEVMARLKRISALIGGFTIANPSGPPPLSGSYLEEPLERSFPVSLMIEDSLVDQGTGEIEDFILWLAAELCQREILCYSHWITRYVPRRGGGKQSLVAAF